MRMYAMNTDDKNERCFLMLVQSIARLTLMLFTFARITIDVRVWHKSVLAPSALHLIALSRVIVEYKHEFHSHGEWKNEQHKNRADRKEYFVESCTGTHTVKTVKCSWIEKYGRFREQRRRHDEQEIYRIR